MKIQVLHNCEPVFQHKRLDVAELMVAVAFFMGSWRS